MKSRRKMYKPDQARMRPKRFSVQVGPTSGRLYIDDDDFHWDALLRVSGDFENDAQKMRYAKAIAKILSEHEDDIPYRPAVRRGG